MRAQNYYVPAAWEDLLNLRGWTNHQVASACGFSDEHIANVLNGVTAAARRDTKMKVVRGMTTLLATEAEIAALFSSEPVRAKPVLSNGVIKTATDEKVTR